CFLREVRDNAWWIMNSNSEPPATPDDLLPLWDKIDQFIAFASDQARKWWAQRRPLLDALARLLNNTTILKDAPEYRRHAGRPLTGAAQDRIIREHAPACWLAAGRAIVDAGLLDDLGEITAQPPRPTDAEAVARQAAADLLHRAAQGMMAQEVDRRL